MPHGKKARIGDVFTIPLKDGRTAFGHYLFQLNQVTYGFYSMFQLVQLYSPTIAKIKAAENALELEPIFGPNLVDIFYPIRKGRWKIIGNLDPGNVNFPNFRHTFNYGDGTYGKKRGWKITNGIDENFVGDLPPEYKGSEFYVGNTFGAVEQRLENNGWFYDNLY